jgi:tripartite-type tricarboxylate transporter receptor subunit TctC
MKCSRRRFLRMAASASGLAIFPRQALAQAYPKQPVRIIVGFGPGGASDIVARLIGQSLSERLGQSFIIENRPGASTNIATETVVRAPADGYTLLLVNNSNVFNPAMYDKLNFDFLRDIQPISGVAAGGGIMEVAPSFPAKTLEDFIALAKSSPGKITMATSGVGSAPHIWGELFKLAAGVDLVAVAYRGGSAPALTDLIGGQVQVTFDPLVSSIEFIRAGKLRPLGVTSAARSELLPGVPTIGEFVRDYRADAWWGLGAPKKTSPEIVAILNREINAALADAKMKARRADLTLTPINGSPAEFSSFVADEAERWGKVIRSANIRVE